MLSGIQKRNRRTEDEFPNTANDIDRALDNVGEEVDDATEEVEDRVDDGIDQRHEGADDGGNQFVDGLEEVFKGRDKFRHLGLSAVWTS